MAFLDKINGHKRYIINGITLLALVLEHFVTPGAFPPEWQAYALPVVAILNGITKIIDSRTPK